MGIGFNGSEEDLGDIPFPQLKVKRGHRINSAFRKSPKAKVGRQIELPFTQNFRYLWNLVQRLAHNPPKDRVIVAAIPSQSPGEPNRLEVVFDSSGDHKFPVLVRLKGRDIIRLEAVSEKLLAPDFRKWALNPDIAARVNQSEVINLLARVELVHIRSPKRLGLET